MNMHNLGRATGGVALGILAAAVMTACDGQADLESVATDAPVGSRIGNVATAQLEPVGDSGLAGTVTFAQLEDTLRIEASITGAPAGEHGFHIHETGDCSAPDASSAGGHFSPDADPHGAPTDLPAQHHAGDLGNLKAGPGGTVEVVREDAELSLVGTYGVVGKAVIVHGGADDLVSQPSGDAGDRIACGVIEWGTAAD
jgi:Cu-Zn family superoxide dismutase